MEKVDARLVSVELDEVDELALVDELPFRALSISDRLSEPSPLLSTLLISWLAISDAVGGGGGGAELCRALASSLALSEPSPLVSSLLKAADRDEVSVELDLLADELPRALSISDRLSEPSPLVSVELISWLAIWSNGELEVELDVVEDELEPLS